jgi:uncharacterized protein (TIGR02147 family)
MEKHLKSAIEVVSPTSFLDHRSFLEALFVRLKGMVKPYSYHRFADDLGFSPSNLLHQYVRGQRSLTEKASDKIVESLGLAGREKDYFLGLVALGRAKSDQKKDILLSRLLKIRQSLTPKPLEKSQMEYYSQWYHAVIREMVRLDHFHSDPHWIAKTIMPRIRPDQARLSLALLEKLNMIRFDKEKVRHVAVDEQLSTGHEAHQALGIEILNWHSKMLAISRKSLSFIEPEQRDYSGMTLCVSEHTAKVIKTMIHQFQMQILSQDSLNQDRDRVLQVNIQMFPVT